MMKHALMVAVTAAVSAVGVQAKTIGFEAAEGYVSGALSSQPSSGSKWSNSTNLFYVVPGIGNPGNAIRSAASDTTPAVAAYTHIQYAPSQADLGSVPTTKDRITFGFDIAVNTPSDVASSTAFSSFMRVGSDDVEFFIQRDGNLEIRSSATNFVAKTGGGADFDFDVFGTGAFLRIEGVADYENDTFTVSVNGVQQSHPTAGLNIPFKNGAQAANIFDHLRFQTNVASNDVAYRQMTVDNVTFALVPEPAMLGLVGLTGLLALRKRSA